jgi:hypothetical protein
VLRPSGLIVEVVTRNDHATIATQDCLSATDHRKDGVGSTFAKSRRTGVTALPSEAANERGETLELSRARLVANSSPVTTAFRQSFGSRPAYDGLTFLGPTLMADRAMHQRSIPNRSFPNRSFP